MTSRLDRLFQLLENGSTPLTRKAAALQLGEVQKLHPHELNNLLIKVRQYLHNTLWDTRIAASQAVEAIVANVPLWLPSGLPEVKKEDGQENPSLVGRMTFDKYDVHTVIKCGYNLLASEGKEFDSADSTALDSSDNREKIALLRQSLNERLGLKIGERCLFQLDFISDLVDSDCKNSDASNPMKPFSENKLDEVFTRISSSGSRKRKSNRKANGCSEPEPKKRVKMEPSDDSCSLPDSVDSDNKNEWPLEWFTDELMGDLFSPHWEIRHGAATGLREIIKLQGKCGGRVKNAASGEQDTLNQQWLEDLSLRLLSVLALDRFGDFLSDQVVAPVRETCAQALGLAIKLLSVERVDSVLRILLQLLDCSEWEARHGGMLGLKYLLAIRQDLIDTLLPEVFEPVFRGLKDSVDDVSAVAAAALVPVKNELMKLIPEKVPIVIAFLWEALLDLDELSSSTGDLLMLLSSLLTFKGLEMKHNLLAYDDSQLVVLIPRLWPFLSHSLSSVRMSVLDSLMILCDKSSHQWLTTDLLSEALRLLYQRSLVESVSSILTQLYNLWIRLLSKANYDLLIQATCTNVTGWIVLMMHSQKIAIEPCNNPVWLELKHRNRHPELSVQSEEYYIGGSESFGEASEDREKCVIRARCQCARLIGTLAYFLTEQKLHSATSGGDQSSPQEALDSFVQILLIHLNSRSAIQRMCSAWIIKEWAEAKVGHEGESAPLWISNNGTLDCKLQLPKVLADRCLELLQEQIYYDEVTIQFSRIQLQFRDFLNMLRSNKVSFDESSVSGKTVHTIQQISAFLEEISSNSLPALRAKQSGSKKAPKNLKQTISSVEQRVGQIRRLLSEMTAYSNCLSISVNSSMASALVAWHFLPEKLNPIIRPIMDSIKGEVNEQLQRGSASSLVQLLRLCCERIIENPELPTPLPKIIKNLITYLCSDRSFTPEVALSSGECQLGILTLDNMQRIAEKNITLRRSNSLNAGRSKATSDEAGSGKNGSMNGVVATGSGSTSECTTDSSQNEILRRGATLALSESCRYFQGHLPSQLSSLWENICVLIKTESLPPFDESGLERARQLNQCLQVLEVIGPHVDSQLHSKLLEVIAFLCLCLESQYISLRHMASRCFGMLAPILPNQTMEVVLTTVLELLEAADCEVKRQGAVETVCCVIERLSLNIVPYIVFLIVPMLGRMSDQNENVRLLASHCFAQLVQLMPLDNVQQNNGSKTEPNGDQNSIVKIEFSEQLLRRKESERHFLEQLMNIRKLDDYKLPVPVDAELRTYQQDGLNWLAFLNKYKLHGIVADEMGLGKTLQAICILASDHHYQCERYQSGECSNKPLLSIVICPPTLTGHWMYEVDKFVSSQYLHPMMYTGPPFERYKLKATIKKAINAAGKNSKRPNLVIASYDLVRNDVDFFSSIKWNYCILDEGHVIKNGKTKLAKAIKSLTANHRLILTGTPIQNNVLELWSLFDFLMPGFLGTERQFMARYSKPILASRDAKSSSKEQETGILAMENLHRQVLPFILRRMKEDVLKDLPPKIIQDYYCELSPLQAQLYEDFNKSKARHTLKETIDEEVNELTSSNKKEDRQTNRIDVNKSHIFQSLQYLRKVCNHPKLVLSASHPRYESILAKLSSEKTGLSDINHAAKLCALKQLLLDCGIGTQSIGGQSEPVVNQHRALVFCQLKSMLDIVENDLLKVHMPTVSYLRLDGDVPANSRYSVIHSFNNDPSIDILLLTTQVGGLGLNLTGADTVIFVEHDWNPMKDLQAMDRAHRIGQKKVVNVYRLITTGTLEEKIMGLQKFKLTIANTVITNDNSNLDSMATDQLLDLFELSSTDKSSKSGSSDSSGITSKTMSIKSVLDSLPELWDTSQYDNQYDLNTFLNSLQQN